MTREMLGYPFHLVTTIEPDREKEGRVKEFLPQARYQNRRGLSVSRHGTGPFCRFRIPSNLSFAGVYIITVDGSITYVGECHDLSERFNARGYATISPRNCFDGGQPTNCKVNNLILQNAKESRRIELWFYQTSNRKCIEDTLIGRLQPPWNSR